MDREIGFIGVGSMGLPMARNLLQRGFKLRVYNRTEGRSRELVRLGAVAVEVPADAVRTDGLVVTMVSDDQALLAVTTGPGGIGARMGRGGLHVSMSTVSPEVIRRLAEQHRQAGAALVSAPVSGRPDAAEAASLTVWLAGADEDKRRTRPVLEAMASAIYDVGAEPSAGNVAKLAANLMVLSSVEALAEALELAARGGVDRRALAAALTERLFPGPVTGGYGMRLASGSVEEKGFKVALALKDIDLVLKTAASADVALPFAQALHHRLKSVYAKGMGQRDVSALAADLLPQTSNLRPHSIAG
ncbi:MAG TPA: NAD(P)-dependent oxidoreductase [Burkholderiaceae bacterium]|jgi:3-hydroxyisobutyrate dehydrogenase-like beta-hydroxyacid dehydrogenase|nr:NAD(P)-dependent oxidoreductase [Burkholderiaceae bacterium]